MSIRRTAKILSFVALVFAAIVARIRADPERVSVIGSSQPVVWMFNHYATPPDMAGGTRHYELATLLKEYDWNPVIFATAFNHRTGEFDRPSSWSRPLTKKAESGVNFVWLYSTPYADNGAHRYLNMVSFAGTSLIAGIRGSKPAVVIGSSPHLLAAFSAWIVSQWHRVPFVLEIRDLWPDSLVQLGLSNAAIINSLSMIERFLYRRASAIIALTHGIADGIIEKGVSPEKVVLIPNAAKRPRPLDPENRAAERHRRGWQDRTVAIWIGAHGPANGLEHVVDAARLLAHRDDILFAFVGDGPDKSDLTARAVGLHNIEFHDPVPKESVSQILRAADIGILHSRAFHAFTGARPNKLFDYMAAGLPIVCAIPGEALNVVEEAGAGIGAEWENAQSISDGICQLASSPDFRARIGTSGFTHVSHGHSREDTAITLHELLTHITAPSQTSISLSTDYEVRRS